jgi:hypothetical protein
MKYLAIIAALFLSVVVTPAEAAPWTDNGNGTWSAQVTITVSTDLKNKYEQCRAACNFEHRYAGQEWDASAWISALLLGTADRTGNVVMDALDTMWADFKGRWLRPDQGFSDAAALAIVVPASPAAP